KSPDKAGALVRIKGPIVVLCDSEKHTLGGLKASKTIYVAIKGGTLFLYKSSKVQFLKSTQCTFHLAFKLFIFVTLFQDFQEHKPARVIYLLTCSVKPHLKDKKNCFELISIDKSYVFQVTFLFSMKD